MPAGLGVVPEPAEDPYAGDSRVEQCAKHAERARDCSPPACGGIGCSRLAADRARGGRQGSCDESGAVRSARDHSIRLFSGLVSRLSRGSVSEMTA